MELVDLELGLKHLASQGYTLNVHEITGLNAGMAKLQWQEKYDRLYVWGKVTAAKNTYYVCYGLRYEEGEFPSKNFYYSTEDFVFAELPPVHEEDLPIIEMERNKPFLGDPAHSLVEQTGEAVEGEEEKEREVTEAHKLAVVVGAIDKDCSVVPKGSYTLSGSQQIIETSGFKGLTAVQALKLENYCHLRAAESMDKLRAMAHNDVDFHLHGFLDSLAQDLPKGCWAVRDEAGANVHLRSLLWPGYAAFHVPSTRYFGGLYMGPGLRSVDLAFLL